MYLHGAFLLREMDGDLFVDFQCLFLIAEAAFRILATVEEIPAILLCQYQ